MTPERVREILQAEEDGSPVGRARRVGIRALVVVALVLVVSGPALAAPGESAEPDSNPDLVTACGIDIHVVLDESGSVGSSAGDIRRAFGAFTSALKNTGSRMAVSEFSTVARLPLSGTAARNYTPVTDATIASTFDPYIKTGYNPNGSTNWEDAFRIGRYFLPRPGQQPHLTVFITDGDPNRVIRSDRVTYDPGNANVDQNEYELKVPLSDNSETTDEGNNDAKDRAVPNANAVKAQGSHILVVGVGSALQNQSSLDRIIAVSGPDVFTGSGSFDISTDDVYAVRDFSHLEEALREAAFQLCAPSITVRKLIDLTPSPGPSVDDRIPGEGWDMTATASPPPASWVLPSGATGDTATTTTDGDGFAAFQWKTATPTASNFTIAETVQAGFENVPSLTRCTFQTPDHGDASLPIDRVAGGFSATVPDDAIVTCEMTNRALPRAAITIEKSTNGADADAPPGPFVAVGGAITWSYLVTNTGNTDLSGIAVTDDQGVAVTCQASTLLPGASFTCTAAGVALGAAYANVGTVTAVDSFGTAVSDTDPSHYTGAVAGIDVEKATNGQDADTAPGPFVPVGDPVTWTYLIRNTGTTTLTGVTLTDDRLGTIACGTGTLAPGDTATCTASGTAAAGQYENLASVTGVDGFGQIARDSDPSHYFGEDATVDIEKFTNGEDADARPGPAIPVGDPVSWLYKVTNTGNVPLLTWSVTDDKLGTPACPRILQLAVGQTVVCRAAASAQAGQYDNIGSVQGTTPSGATVTDSDPSHYFGVQGNIDLEKFTNGSNADSAPGPAIAVGAPVTWTYVVTNNGNSPLTGVNVADLQNVAVTCPKTELAIAESMTCTATGVAAAGQYRNIAIAHGITAAAQPVSDEDPSHYFGSEPGIKIVKSTNGVDANTAPGPFIPVGDPVEWTYLVTNTGNGPLTGVTVSDDRGVTVTCPRSTVAAAATMTCTAAGTAVEGAYQNTGSVTATGPAGVTVSDDDPSHYFGAVSQIHVKKATNGDDSDQPTGPSIPAGDPVTWTYDVTNPGNVHVSDVQLVDDDPAVAPRFTGGDTDGDGALDPGETWHYTASGTAVAGQYANSATVTGLDLLENEVSAADPAHYISPNPLAPPLPTSPIAPLPPPLPARPITPKPGLKLTKVAQSTRVRGGKVVRFRLRVTNTGGATARSVKVCDRLPAGLVWRTAGNARLDGRRACFSARSLAPRRARTFRVTAYANLTQHARTICNVATRSANGVSSRRARACIRVLPSRAGCPARAARAPAPGRPPTPVARAAC